MNAYERALYLAGFYSWSARKRFPPVGRDPITGLPWSSHDYQAREAGRASNKALARFWFQQAKEIRKRYGVKLWQTYLNP